MTAAEMLLRKAWSLLNDVEHVLRRADAADLADVAAGFATDVYDRMRLVEHGPSDTPEPAPTVLPHGGSVEGSGARVEECITSPRRPAAEERTEAFIELQSGRVGYNLRHFTLARPHDRGHLTGEGCGCAPERVTQSLTPEPWRADA